MIPGWRANHDGSTTLRAPDVSDEDLVRPAMWALPWFVVQTRENS
jgi:hypothetical protein